MLGGRLPRLKLSHQLRDPQGCGQQEAHPPRRHQRHISRGGAVEGVLRLLRLGPAPAQQKGRQDQRRHQPPQSQRGRRAGCEQFCDRIQGGGPLPQAQTEAHQAAGQGQGGQNMMLSH